MFHAGSEFQKSSLIYRIDFFVIFFLSFLQNLFFIYFFFFRSYSQSKCFAEVKTQITGINPGTPLNTSKFLNILFNRHTEQPF